MPDNYSINELLKNAVSKYSKNEMLITSSSRITFDDFFQKVLKSAAVLKSQNLTVGDRIGIALEDSATFIVYFFGAIYCGYVPVPTNLRNDIKSLNGVLENAQISLLVSVSIINNKINYEGKKILIDQMDIEAFHALPANQSIDFDDCMIIYTSGTTGIPKGVVLDHKSVYLNNFYFSEALQIEEKGKLLMALPLFLANAMSHFIANFFRGACIYLMDNFLFPGDYYRKIIDEKIDTLLTVPAQLFQLSKVVSEEKLPPTLKRFVSSSDFLSSELIDFYINQNNKLLIYQVYGISELAPRVTVLNAKDVLRKRGSIGKPLPCHKIKILDDDFKEAKIGEQGQIAIKSKTIMRCYFNNQELTKKSFWQEYYLSGDFGYLDNEGFLYYYSRKDDMFKSGGEKVHINKILEMAQKLNGVIDLACIPLKDERFGQVPLLFLVYNAKSYYNANEVYKFLKKNLPKNHIPEKIMCVTELPRTASGKIDRKKLLNIFEVQNEH